VSFCCPAVLAVVLYALWRGDVLSVLDRIALESALLGPWTMLAIAWDLSRLLVLGNAM